MKIVLIHGQNHKGSSYNIGKMLSDKFSNSEIKEYFLPKDLEHFCVGCYKCIHDEQKCPFYTEKNKIMSEVEKADLLIFTTPTYCMRASAPMKSFIDLTFTYWMSHKPRKCMFSKQAIVISTAAGAGAGSAVKDIANTLFYWGVPVVKKYAVAVQAMSWEEVKPKKKASIEKDIDKIAKSISFNKVCVGIKTKFLFSAMRMMQNKGWGASVEEKEYWSKNGWLNKARPWNNK